MKCRHPLHWSLYCGPYSRQPRMKCHHRCRRCNRRTQPRNRRCRHKCHRHRHRQHKCLRRRSMRRGRCRHSRIRHRRCLHKNRRRSPHLRCSCKPCVGTSRNATTEVSACRVLFSHNGIAVSIIQLPEVLAAPTVGRSNSVRSTASLQGSCRLTSSIEVVSTVSSAVDDQRADRTVCKAPSEVTTGLSGSVYQDGVRAFSAIEDVIGKRSLMSSWYKAVHRRRNCRHNRPCNICSVVA